MKKICIVSNVIGNRNVIENGKNGFLCDNIEEYKKTINNIIQNKEKINLIVYNARKDVVEKYNTKREIEEYMKIYMTDEEKKI